MKLSNRKEILKLIQRLSCSLLILLCNYSLHADNNQSLFDSANASYAKADYNKAIQQYESILNQEVESAELYFNLGNAYYKTNKIGLAILNYERGKKLSPNDEDILFNLKLANQKTEDKIDTAPQLFLTEWKNELSDLMTEKSWSILCIVLLCISLGLIAVYILSTNSTLKKTGFFGGCVLGILTISIFFIAQAKYNNSQEDKEAVITSASVTVTGSPNEKGTKLFILHEGSKVILLQEENDWSEIKIANGNVGWVKSNMLSSI